MPGRTPWQFFPGLDQTGKLGEGARQVYSHALDNILFPRLIFRLEAQMRQNFDNPAFLYQATRVYLMLGSLGPLDRNCGQGVDALRLAGRVSGSRRRADP